MLFYWSEKWGALYAEVEAIFREIFLKVTVKKLKVSLLVFLLSTNTMQASYNSLAKLAGISAYKMNKIIQKLVKVETSTGKYDVVNHRSGAYGRYQIMPSTAEWYAKKLDIPFASWKAPKNQDKIFKAILQDNIASLKKHKYKITAFTIYAAHQQGFHGFYVISRNKVMSRDIENNIRANLPKKYAKIHKKLLRLVWILYWKKKLR
jgi:hypothetical protein